MAIKVRIGVWAHFDFGFRQDFEGESFLKGPEQGHCNEDGGSFPLTAFQASMAV